MNTAKSSILDKNYTWFKKHEKELLEKYGRCTVLIHNEQVAGVIKASSRIARKAYSKLYKKGVKKFGLGYFIIQQVPDMPIYIYSVFPSKEDK